MADVRKLKEKATEAFSKGKFVKAAEAYAEYCEADPKDLQARLRMGDAWSKGGKKEKAIEAYTWAAEGFAKDGFLPRAIAASKLILELDPSHKGVQKMLADLYARKTTAPGSQSSSRAASSLKVETRVETQTTAAGFSNRKDAIELDAKPAAVPRRPVSAAVPEAPPTPMNRKDAIDLPEYEIPGMEPESASGSASVPMAKRGPSPTRREDAIEIVEEDTGPKGPRELQNTAIELDVSVTGTSATAVPPPPAPKPSAPEPVLDLEVEVPIVGIEVKTPEPPPPPAKPAESYELEVKPAPEPPPPPPPPPAPPKPAEAPEKVWDLSEEAEEIEEVQELEVVETTTSEEIQLVDVAEAAPSAPPKPPKPQLEVIPDPPKAKPQLEVVAEPAPATAPGEFSGSFQITVEGEQSGSFKPPPAAPKPPEPEVAAVPPPPPPPPPAPPPEPPPAKLSEGEQSGSFRVTVTGEGSGAFRKDGEKSGSFPPGMKPRKSPTQEVPVAAAPLPAPSSVAPPPSSPRIWLPGNFNAPAVTDAAPSSAEAEFTSAPEPAAPPAAASLTDLERGLQIFSSFDAEDFRPTKPAPVAAAVAAAPPPPEPVAEAPAPSAAARRTFTELELEGDSLLHAVETAAAVGVEQRGEAASDGLEEPMEMPDDQKLPPGELPKIPLFSDLPPDAFIALFERCPLKRAEPGDVIIQQGSLGDSFYVICAGSVKVFRMDGEQRREIATLEEGAFFGEMALLSGSARAASVEAATEDTQLLEISAPILTELSHRYPQVATALKKFCRQRLLSNLMASATIFQPFSRQDRRDLVQRFKARDVQKGDVLIKEGTRSDGMYVILSGEVEVRVGPTQVASLKEGDVFGEMSLLTKAVATATVAASKRTSLLRLPREDFDLIIMSHPQVLVLVSELTDSRAKQNAAIASHRPATADAAPMI